MSHILVGTSNVTTSSDRIKSKEQPPLSPERVSSGMQIIAPEKLLFMYSKNVSFSHQAPSEFKYSLLRQLCWETLQRYSRYSSSSLLSCCRLCRCVETVQRYTQRIKATLQPNTSETKPSPFPHTAELNFLDKHCQSETTFPGDSRGHSRRQGNETALLCQIVLCSKLL